MRYLWPYRLTALGALVGLMISSLASLAGPRILAWGVDDGVKALDLAVVWKSCALLVGVAAGRSVFGFLQGYWSEVASQGVAFDLDEVVIDEAPILSFAAPGDVAPRRVARPGMRQLGDPRRDRAR